MPPSRPHVILFDLDGTLLDRRSAETAAAAEFIAGGTPCSAPANVDEFCRAWRSARERHLPAFLRRQISYDEYHRWRIRDALAVPDLSDADAGSLYARYSRAYRRAWRLYDDVVPCLDALRGARLAVLSNGHGPHQRAKLDALGIARRFERIFVSDELSAPKPDAAAFVEACGRLNAEPGACCLVGDDLASDAHAAYAAGLCGIWLCRGREGHRNGIPTITSLAELPALLQQAGSLPAAGAIPQARLDTANPALPTWITPQLAVGGAPPPGGELKLLRDFNIRLIVDLREEACCDVRAIRREGRQVLYLPTPDLEPPRRRAIGVAVERARQSLARGERVLIHCQHGIGRSVLVAACVLVATGVEPRAALSHIKRMRPIASPSPRQLEGMLAYLRSQNGSNPFPVPSWQELADIVYCHSESHQA